MHNHVHMTCDVVCNCQRSQRKRGQGRRGTLRSYNLAHARRVTATASRRKMHMQRWQAELCVAHVQESERSPCYRYLREGRAGKVGQLARVVDWITEAGLCRWGLHLFAKKRRLPVFQMGCTQSSMVVWELALWCSDYNANRERWNLRMPRGLVFVFSGRAAAVIKYSTRITRTHQQLCVGKVATAAPSCWTPSTSCSAGSGPACTPSSTPGTQSLCRGCWRGTSPHKPRCL